MRVLCVITVCSHRTALYCEWSRCAVTELPCTVSDHCVQSPNCSVWEWSLCVTTELPCAVSDHCVQSPNCPVRWVITVCGHRTALCGEWSPCAVTKLWSTCRHCLCYCFQPLIERELQDFRQHWNSHRLRANRLDHCPSGIPGDIYTAFLNWQVIYLQLTSWIAFPWSTSILATTLLCTYNRNTELLEE